MMRDAQRIDHMLGFVRCCLKEEKRTDSSRLWDGSVIESNLSFRMTDDMFMNGT